MTTLCKRDALFVERMANIITQRRTEGARALRQRRNGDERKNYKIRNVFLSV